MVESMSEQQLRDFAKTKRKSLPPKKKQDAISRQIVTSVSADLLDFVIKYQTRIRPRLCTHANAIDEGEQACITMQSIAVARLQNSAYIALPPFQTAAAAFLATLPLTTLVAIASRFSRTSSSTVPTAMGFLIRSGPATLRRSCCERRFNVSQY